MNPDPASRVFACIDDSCYAESVCDYASWSAQRLSAPLSLIHVLEESHSPALRNLSGSIGFGAQEALLEELAVLDARRAGIAREQGSLILAAARERTEQSGQRDVETRQLHGELIGTLQDLESEMRMLVVGKRGGASAAAHGHIGNHLERIIRALQKPVLISQQSFQAPRTFMIAFDGSSTIKKGIEMIAGSPLLRGLACHLVMAGEDNESNQAQLDQARQLLQKADIRTQVAIVAGEPDSVLLDYQQQMKVDLLIMGAYGHSRIRHLIVGSNTTTMLCKTTVPLMILR